MSPQRPKLNPLAVPAVTLFPFKPAHPEPDRTTTVQTKNLKKDCKDMASDSMSEIDLSIDLDNDKPVTLNQMRILEFEATTGQFKPGQHTGTVWLSPS
jgi:hypothetical protein